MLTTSGLVAAGRASSYGLRTAILDADGNGITYRQLDDQTDRAAGALLRLGLGRGERVVWLAKNTTLFALAYFATAKAQLAFTALNYWLRPDELRQLVELLEPSVFIASDEYADLIEDLAAAGRRRHLVSLGSRPRPGWTPFSALLEAPVPAAGLPSGDETLLHEIVFTSGTTGQSKGVMRSQRKRIVDSVMAALAFQLTRNDHTLSFGPQFHVGGMSGPNQVLIQGGTVSIIQFDPETVARAISRGVTYMAGVPAHYNLLFEEKVLDGVDTSAMRGCYVGGSVATKELFGLIGQHFPNADLVHGYGSTESGPYTMALRGQEFVDHYGSLGLPVPGNEVRVVDSDSHDVAPGDIGELLVRSDTVMDGYYRRPELTRNALDPRRLAPHRRPAQPGSRRLLPPRRPSQGAHHLRRRKRLPQRSRGPHLHPPPRRRSRRHRHPRPHLRRTRHRPHPPHPRRHPSHPRRDHHPRPRPPRRFQNPQRSPHRRRLPPQWRRQDLPTRTPPRIRLRLRGAPMTGPDQFATRRDVIRTEMGGPNGSGGWRGPAGPPSGTESPLSSTPARSMRLGPLPGRTGPRTAATPRATGRSGATAGSTAGPSRSQATI